LDALRVQVLRVREAQVRALEEALRIGVVEAAGAPHPFADVAQDARAEVRMSGAEIADVAYLRLRLEAIEVRMAIAAQARVALNQRTRLLVLEVTAGAAFAREQGDVRAVHVDVVLHVGMAGGALRVPHPLERLAVAGGAVVADGLVRGVQ